MLRELHLYMKKNGEDVDLGSGYSDDVPRAGELLSFSTDHGVTWKVVTIYRHLVAYGSPTWRRSQEGRPHHPGLVDVFVEPIDGPFEP